MHDFMKTILSALKEWVNKRIKNNTPNWNENNPEADGYIKNRPFYTIEGLIELASEKNIIIEEDNGYSEMSSQLIFIPGNTYQVIFNDIMYKCVAWEGDGCWCIGNGNIYGEEGMGENVPFICDSYDDGSWYLNTETAGTYSLTITMVADKVKQIDRKYLPDNIYVQSDWNVTDETNDAFIKNKPVPDSTLTIEGAAADAKATGDVIDSVNTKISELNTFVNIKTSELNVSIAEPKSAVPFIDQVNGELYLVSMRNGNLTSSILKVESIAVTTLPIKTAYVYGEYFDTTGMVVTAICQDGFSMPISAYSYPTTYIANGTTSVEISYVQSDVTYTASVPVTVSEFNPEVVLVDFTYTDNGNDTYTITSWKGTYNGEPSTEMIIPDYGCILV